MMDTWVGAVIDSFHALSMSRATGPLFMHLLNTQKVLFFHHKLTLCSLFFLIRRHSLPLLSAGLHLPPLHLLMLAVSTPSKRSASVTGKTCVNSRRGESAEPAERR